MPLIARIRQMKNVGRFTSFDHPNDDDIRFQKLTLLYARNASGKTTLARMLAAASTDSGTDVELYRTLGEAAPAEVAFEYADKQVRRFDGVAWSGRRPKVLVFDREFIEANVAVGRRPDKSTRQGLLEIALGAVAVAAKHTIDDLSDKGRALTGELKPHAATIRTAAAAAELSEAAFLALSSVQDIDAERSRLERTEREALTAEEVRKRPRPVALPALPDLRLDDLAAVLGKSVTRVADEAELLVRAHLELRLRGVGHAWVRQGVSFDDGATCPYCAQDLSNLPLVQAYRAFFDETWDRYSKAVEHFSAVGQPLDGWWQEARQAGRTNVEAFAAWDDISGLVRPDFESARRRDQVSAVRASLDGLVARKRERIDQALDPDVELADARNLLAELTTAVNEYNLAVTTATDQIDARRTTLGALSIEAARRDLRILDARILRHSPALARAEAEHLRLNQEKRTNELAKTAAEQELKSQSDAKLDAFGQRINRLLETLCADFRIEKLGTERMGGAAAARFTLSVEMGPRDRRELPVTNREGEERLARVLSDGDRSTLALAVFLAGLETTVAMEGHILVLDDPMTSLDWSRCTATAAMITKHADRAKQLLVLSHNAPFLAEVAYDWRRFGGHRDAELAEITLDRGSRSLKPWSAEDHVTHQHLIRWRELSEFARGAGTDDDAPKMQGEIRKYLEGHVRMRWPDWPTTAKDTLEAMVARLRKDPAFGKTVSLTTDAVDELERLCAFGAREHHATGHRDVVPPTPEAVRGMVRRALEFGR